MYTSLYVYNIITLYTACINHPTADRAIFPLKLIGINRRCVYRYLNVLEILKTIQL